MKSTVYERIAKSVARQDASIILRRDLLRFGKPDRVNAALTRLIAERKLVRIGLGVYAKLRIDETSGERVLPKSFEALALEALQRLDVEVSLPAGTKDYLEGRSTQVPMRLRVSTGKKRVSRKMSLGAKKLEYVKNQ